MHCIAINDKMSRSLEMWPHCQIVEGAHLCTLCRVGEPAASSARSSSSSRQIWATNYEAADFCQKSLVTSRSRSFVQASRCWGWASNPIREPKLWTVLEPLLGLTLQIFHVDCLVDFSRTWTADTGRKGRITQGASCRHACSHLA